MKTYHESRLLGLLAVTGALLSVLACYGTLGVIAGLSLLGVAIAVNVHAWAAVIVALAAVSALLVALDTARSRTLGPLALALAGAALVAWVMYASYSRIGELAGFALLLGAALLQHRQRKCPAPIQSRS